MSTKEKTDIGISLVVVIIALGFILYHTTYKPGNFLQADNQESLEAPEILELDGKSYKLTVVNENPEAESSLIKPDSHSGETNLVAKDTFVDTELHGYPSSGDSIEQIEEPEIDSSSNFAAQSQSQTDLAEGTTEILEKNCIILVGSFSKKENAASLKKRLQSEEYEIFESNYQGLHRIGVYINCDSNVQYRELRYLSKNFAVDARLYIED